MDDEAASSIESRVAACFRKCGGTSHRGEVLEESEQDLKQKPRADMIGIVADLVAAYVSNNSMRAADLPEFIVSVHATIAGLASHRAEPIQAAPNVPAVPVKKSVMPDYIICLEDGKKFRSLKRHLGTVYNMTPDEYRAKWGLPKDYPMVAPQYSEIRSKLAKDIGLGQPRVAEPAAAEKTPGRRKRANAA